MLQPLDKLWSAVIGAELSDLLLGQDKKPKQDATTFEYRSLQEL